MTYELHYKWVSVNGRGEVLCDEEPSGITLELGDGEHDKKSIFRMVDAAYLHGTRTLGQVEIAQQHTDYLVSDVQTGRALCVLRRVAVALPKPPRPLNKKRNAYADVIEFDAPKTVWQAIAVSRLTCGGDHIEYANRRAAREWVVLYEGGIVPQRPPAGVFALAGLPDDEGAE